MIDGRRGSKIWWSAVALAAAGTSAMGGPPAPALTAEAATAMVQELLPEVERLRGLGFEKPIPVEVVDEAAARRYMMRRIEDFGQVEPLRVMGRAYELLQLVPPGTDLLDEMLGVMEKQAGGFYDPTRRTYYLLDRVPPAAAPIFTVHELTHALEDQHFGLDARMRLVLDDEDRLVALGAVQEGSATLLMTIYAMQATAAGKLDPQAMQKAAQAEAANQAEIGDLPQVLARQLVGPYVLGMNFLSRGNLMAIAGGFPVESVNRTYRDVPASSEQILHPEKYWDPSRRDGPRRVDLHDAGGLLGAGWEASGHGTLGELSLGPLVGAGSPFDAGDAKALTPAAWTNAAASGWDGDRWELWTRGESALVLWSTVWDSPEDAREFAEALAGRTGMAWEQRGDRVALVAGEAADKTQVLLDRMLSPPG